MPWEPARPHWGETNAASASGGSRGSIRRRAALRGVDLTVDAGTVTGLIGPNGAGKTTCFNAICGLQTISSGRITFDGADMTGLKPHKRARLGIARTFQRLEIFGSLSVRENILAAAEIRRRWSHDRSDAAANADAVLALVGLTHLASRAADTLPTGQARLLELRGPWPHGPVSCSSTSRPRG